MGLLKFKDSWWVMLRYVKFRCVKLGKYPLQFGCGIQLQKGAMIVLSFVMLCFVKFGSVKA